ncbi:MAG TPA: protein TolQ [Steroidobacteraceae bacterium]|nr:protein TolQ [Steroidobacteraceae bacterium]
MDDPHSVLSLILNAGLVVKAVIAMLLLASLVSWTIIFRKRRLVSQAEVEANKFEGTFWSGGDLGKLYRAIESRDKSPLGMESIFEAGFGEFTRLRSQSVPAGELLEGVRRTMRVAQLREIDRLEASLATLATVGSTSPYVGLFGTVWGIMGAFQGLGNAQQATLAMVAPGIAEALIATAAGLFAAIPAVVAYNRYADKMSRLELRYDAFMDEFSTLLQRHAATRT